MTIYQKDMFDNIRYVLVSIELKSSSNIEHQGYFLGFQAVSSKDFEVVKANQKFIWLYRKGAVHMFHCDYYYVSDITIGYGKDNSLMRPFKNNDVSQIEAYTCLDKIVASLKKQDMIRVNGVVDHQKYVGVPEGVKSSIEVDTDKSAHTTNKSNNTSNNYTAQPPVSIYNGTGYNNTRKTISTINFKRTTTYNVTEAMENMARKIEEIKNSTYVAPQLKELSVDEDESTNPSKSVNDFDNSYDYGDIYGC